MDIEVIGQGPLCLEKVKETLAKVKKERKELNMRAEKVAKYVDEFAKVKGKNAEAIQDGIAKLGIPRLKNKHIAKVIDLMPKNADELKGIFVGEIVTLRPEDIRAILEVVSKNVSGK